jgi:hypothetical protein
MDLKEEEKCEYRTLSKVVKEKVLANEDSIQKQLFPFFEEFSEARLTLQAAPFHNIWDQINVE